MNVGFRKRGTAPWERGRRDPGAGTQQGRRGGQSWGDGRHETAWISQDGGRTRAASARARRTTPPFPSPSFAAISTNSGSTPMSQPPPRTNYSVEQSLRRSRHRHRSARRGAGVSPAQKRSAALLFYCLWSPSRVSFVKDILLFSPWNC